MRLLELMGYCVLHSMFIVVRLVMFLDTMCVVFSGSKPPRSNIIRFDCHQKRGRNASNAMVPQEPEPLAATIP